MSQKSRFCKLQNSTDFNRIPHQFYHHFCIIFTSFFHSNFMYFRNPLPESIFGGSKGQSLLKSVVLDRFSVFLRSRNRPLEHHFRSKCQRKVTRPSRCDPPWADLARFGAENGPRTHRHWFWYRFWSIWRGYWTSLDGFFMIFVHVTTILMIISFGQIQLFVLSLNVLLWAFFAVISIHVHSHIFRYSHFPFLFSSLPAFSFQ